MTDTLSRVAGPVALVSGAQTVFTGTAAHVYTNLDLRIVNDSVSTISVKVGINGTSDADLILPAISLGPGDLIDDTSRWVLEGTDTLEVDVDADGLTLTLSVLDQS